MAHTPAARKNWKKAMTDPVRQELAKKKSEATHLTRTGFKHHFCNPEVQQRIIKNSRFAKTCKVQGQKFVYRGYEKKAIEYLVSKGVDVKDIETFTVSAKNLNGFEYRYKGKTRNYIPDLKVKTRTGSVIVEVKSLYTAGLVDEPNSKAKWLETRAKARAVTESGERFALLVFEPGSDTPVCKGFGSITKKALDWRT